MFRFSTPCFVLFAGFLFLPILKAAPPVIIIDPGHGGSSVAGSLSSRSNSSPNNANSPGGLKEKDLTLEFSKILHDEILRQASGEAVQVGVLLTRHDDRNLNFIERAAIANRSDTACVISIHFNAGGGGKAKGSLSLISARERNANYAADEAFGKALAEACNAGVRQYLPSSKSRGVITDGHLHGGLGSNFFFQMARHKNLRSVPKCFLEVEFMDNPDVEKALLKGNREEKFRTIAASIAEYLIRWIGPKAK
ncbi:MAG: N-acetylmuramoyl-L-alanine amidase [Verrucomicrobiales bacterium]|nr:N-acetylmuramoyl-L-alanine amidase [Verrucomicrobiales bacterium]